MQARKLTAGDGWTWLPAGLRIFRRNPAFLTASTILFFVAVSLTMTVARVMPLLGLAMMVFLIPAMSVSLMNVARTLDRGAPVMPQLLLSGFRSNYRQLVILGVIQMMAAVLLVLSAFAIDDGLFLRLLMGLDTLPEGEGLPAASLLSAVLTAVLVTAFSMAWWYAPVLTVWHRLPAVKSLFFSFVACVRNWRPFCTYGIGAALLSLLFPQLLGFVLLQLLPDQPGLMRSVLMLVIVFFILPTMFGSFYVSYREVFTEEDVQPHADEYA